jgi:hypothetical protein
LVRASVSNTALSHLRQIEVAFDVTRMSRQRGAILNAAIHDTFLDRTKETFLFDVAVTFSPNARFRLTFLFRIEAVRYDVRSRLREGM